MKWGIWCTRKASSIFGFSEAWLKTWGVPDKFDTKEQAEARAEALNRVATRNLHYEAREMT